MPGRNRYDEAPISPPPEVDSPQGDQNHGEETDEEDEDSGGNSLFVNDDDDDGYLVVKLADIRKEVQCPICLGIVRKTRTVMGCLHRFCRDCIDKSMRLGKNECPACRAHCSSRRSLRDDPSYDALIAILFPKLDQYEAKELAFREKDKARNKEIQDSIAQTWIRQSEALGKKQTSARATAAAFVRSSLGNSRNLRKRKTCGVAEPQELEINGNANDQDGGRVSSADEPGTEVQLKKCKQEEGANHSQPALAADTEQKESEVVEELLGASTGLIGGSEILAWGKGGTRSQLRHCNLSSGTVKTARNNHISKLINHLLNQKDSEDEMNIHVTLVSLDVENMPNLQMPYLCCNPALSIGHLCQYVAIQTLVGADEVEMLLVKDIRCKSNTSGVQSLLPAKSITVDPNRDELHFLMENETLASLEAAGDVMNHQMLIAYRKKLSVAVNQP